LLFDEASSDPVAVFVQPLATDDFDLPQASVQEHDAQSLFRIERLAMQDSNSAPAEVAEVHSEPRMLAGQSGQRLPVFQGDTIVLAAAAKSRKTAFATGQRRYRSLLLEGSLQSCRQHYGTRKLFNPRYRWYCFSVAIQHWQISSSKT
jgi:hypothetical protein